MQSQTNAEETATDTLVNDSAIGVSYDEIIGLTSGKAEEAAVEEETEEKPEEEAKESAEEEKAPAKEAKKSEPESKKPATGAKAQLQAKTPDGKTLDLAADTKFIKKVEGVDREVSLKEALDHYAFDVNYTKKYQEVSEKKKEAETQLGLVKEKEAKVQKSLQLVGTALTDTTKALAEGDVDGFLRKFADLTQTSPAVLKQALRNYYLPYAQKYLEADEAERRLIDATEKEKAVEEDHKSIEERRAIATKIQKYQGFTAQKVQESGITPEEWDAADKFVISEYLGGVPPDLKTIEPWQVQQYVETVILMAQGMRQESAVTALIEKAAPNLAETDKETFDEVKKTIAPFIKDLDEAEIVSLIKKVVAQDSISDEEEEEIEVLDDKAGQPRKKTASTGGATKTEDWNPLSVYED